jgi:hypothetical protein
MGHTHRDIYIPLHEGLVRHEDAGDAGVCVCVCVCVWGTPSKGIGDRLPDESSRKFLRYV